MLLGYCMDRLLLLTLALHPRLSPKQSICLRIEKENRHCVTKIITSCANLFYIALSARVERVWRFFFPADKEVGYVGRIKPAFPDDDYASRRVMAYQIFTRKYHCYNRAMSFDVPKVHRRALLRKRIQMRINSRTST